MFVPSTHAWVDLVPEVVEVTGTAQATHLPNGVVCGNSVVASALQVEAHQVHTEPELWCLV